MTLDAIERVEVSIRTKLVYPFSHAHGPFGYCDDTRLPKLKISEYLEWRMALQEETDRSKETFKKHFFEKYGDQHRNLPLWMLTELMSMGSLLTFFKGVEPDLKRRVAEEHGLPDEVALSWLRSLNAARNICATIRVFGIGRSAIRPCSRRRKHGMLDRSRSPTAAESSS